jgi:hypothetical protein
MPERPRPEELLRTARQTLLEDLLPVLPQAMKYPALMIANVMAISAREFDAGELVLAKQLQRLEALYPEAEPPIAGATPTERLALVETRLAADIRCGRFADRAAGPLRDALLALTRARLGLSNPKYLQGWDATRRSRRSPSPPPG